MEKIYVSSGISHYDMMNLYINDVFDIILEDENKRLKHPNFSYKSYVTAHGDKLSETREINRLYNIRPEVSCFFVMAYFYASKKYHSLYTKHYNIEKSILEIKEFMDKFTNVINKLENYYIEMSNNSKSNEYITPIKW